MENTYQLELLLYNAQIDRSDIKQIKKYYGTCRKKTSKSVTTNTQILLQTKVKKKLQNCQNISKTLKIVVQIVASERHPYTGGSRKCDLCLI